MVDPVSFFHMDYSAYAAREFKEVLPPLPKLGRVKGQKAAKQANHNGIWLTCTYRKSPQGNVSKTLSTVIHIEEPFAIKAGFFELDNTGKPKTFLKESEKVLKWKKGPNGEKIADLDEKGNQKFSGGNTNPRNILAYKSVKLAEPIKENEDVTIVRIIGMADDRGWTVENGLRGSVLIRCGDYFGRDIKAATKLFNGAIGKDLSIILACHITHYVPIPGIVI